MRYRKLSSTGDYTFGASQRDFLVDSSQAVGQAVLTSLKLWFGEWYINTLDGLPYPEGVTGYHSQASSDLTIQTAILGVTVIVSSTNVPIGALPGQSVAGVTSIESYSSSVDPETRAYSADCTINTIYGQTQIQILNAQNL